MNIDFQEILKELEFRLPTGIINLNVDSQVTILVDILRESGVDDANHLAQKARGYFGFINEASKTATPTKKSAVKANDDVDSILSKSFENPETGRMVTVASALGYDTTKKAYGIAKKMFSDAGYSEKDVDMVDAGPDDEEKPVKGKSVYAGKGAKVFPQANPNKKSENNLEKLQQSSDFKRGSARLNKSEKETLNSLLNDLDSFYKTTDQKQKTKIANAMIDKYELSASDNKQKCYIGVFSQNQEAKKMLGKSEGGFGSKLVTDLEKATNRELTQASPSQKLTSAAKPDLIDKSKASNDSFVASVFKTEPLSFLESKFYELHGPLDKDGKLIGPSGGKNAKAYFMHSITRNKAIDNTISVAEKLEKQNEIKPGLSDQIKAHKKEMERIGKNMTIPSKEASAAVGNSYAKLAEKLMETTGEKTTGAIMKQFAEMALYDTEIANGDECYLPSAGNFPSGDKIKLTRKGTKIEKVASVSVKYGLKNGFYGFPGEAAQYQNYHPDSKYRERLNSHPGTPGYSLGVSDDLVDNEKSFAKLFKESDFGKFLNRPDDLKKLHGTLKNAKSDIDSMRKEAGVKSFKDMLPMLKSDPDGKNKTLEGINNKYAKDLEKLFNKEKLIELLGKDNAEVFLKGPIAMMCMMTFSSTLRTSNGLNYIQHNHQDIQNGEYHSRTDTGSPDIKLWKLMIRYADERGGGLIASFNSDRSNSDYFEKRKSKNKSVPTTNLDNKTIKNPETGENISLKSALTYDKNSTVYKAAAKLIKNK